MELFKRQERAGVAVEAPETLVAHVYDGEVPPDFAAIAACGFSVVLLDTAAPWFSDKLVAAAKAEGLVVVSFRMGHAG
jgi:hypothetical protein